MTNTSIRSVNFLIKAVNHLTRAMSESKGPIKEPKYDGRIKKRQWEERRSDRGERVNFKQAKCETKQNGEENSQFERIKRRKHVLLLGYSGVGYFGMQRNPNSHTIEEDLLKALLKTNLITEEGYNQVQTMQFQRAARTDKGVSAARQIVSLKLPEEVDVAQINKELPEVIRVFSTKRVTKGFNSKSSCDSRTYFYMLPTAAFTFKDDNTSQYGFRIDSETFERVNKILKLFVGTKNFHNFTSKKSSQDPSANRYIKTFFCETPFVRDDVEFAVLKVQGQSFMLHQIRKMVALMLAIVRKHTDEATLIQAFTSERISIPRAPGLGLVLDYVHYDRYNFRYGTDGVHDKLTWEEVEDDVNLFTEKYIYPTIINAEIQEQEMLKWIHRKLIKHKYDDLDENKNDDEEKSDNEVEETPGKLEVTSCS